MAKRNFNTDPNRELSEQQRHAQPISGAPDSRSEPEGDGSQGGFALGQADYRPKPEGRRSYLDRRSCKVNVYDMAADILTGDASPMPWLASPAAWPSRLGAAIPARTLGDQFNQGSHTCC